MSSLPSEERLERAARSSHGVSLWAVMYIRGRALRRTGRSSQSDLTVLFVLGASRWGVKKASQGKHMWMLMSQTKLAGRGMIPSHLGVPAHLCVLDPHRRLGKNVVRDH